MTLFDFSNEQKVYGQPLADRMRPRSLDEFIGQEHIVGPGKLLRRAIMADKLTSSIFYGPPGCGKTSLASVIAQMTKASFVRMNALHQRHSLPTRSGPGLMVCAPGCHLAGHTSPWWAATNWQACTRRSSSSAFRPTLPSITS